MEVTMGRTTLGREMLDIRRAFTALAAAFERLGPALAERQVAVASTNGAAPTRRRVNLSPKQRAALKLQGKYMGTMRGLKPGQRAAVKKLRAEKGIQAAIKEAVRLAAIRFFNPPAGGAPQLGCARLSASCPAFSC
jgi:hypothetical protein